MKTILFKKNGSLLLVDKLARVEEKIDTLKYYLDCPVMLEDGITFGTFFNHIFKIKTNIKALIDAYNLIPELSASTLNVLHGSSSGSSSSSLVSTVITKSHRF